MVKKSDSVMAIELAPGTNHYINCEPVDPKPPAGFIDSTVKLGRLQPDGTVEWYDTQDPYPEGCDDHYKRLNGFGRQPEPGEEKGEDIMRDNQYNWPAIIEDGLQLLKDGKPLYAAAMEVKSKYDMNVTPQSIYTRIKKEAQKQGVVIPEGKRTKAKPASAAPLPKEKPAEINADFDSAFTEPPAAEPDPGQQPAKEYINAPVIQVQLPDNFDEEFDAALEKQLARREQPEPPRSQYDPSDNDFTCEDNDPIPFRPVNVKPQVDLSCMKLILIETVIGEGPCQGLPPDIILELIGQIKDLEVGA